MTTDTSGRDLERLICTALAGHPCEPRVMTSLMKDDTQLFNLFMDDAGFKRWLTETMFQLT